MLSALGLAEWAVLLTTAHLPVVSRPKLKRPGNRIGSGPYD